jgi:hypothetical protein
MPIANLRPSAEGTYTAFILGAGVSKTAAVDPGPSLAHDDAASYIRIGTSPGVSPACRQSFFLDTGIPAAMDAVNSLSLNTRARSNGAAGVESYHHFIRTGTGGGALEGSELDAPGYIIYDAPGGTYRTFTTAGIPKPGGGSWGTGDIVAGNLQMILAVQFDSVLQFYFTSTWVSLDFDAPPAGSGGMILMMWSVLGPVLGAAMTLAQMQAAADLAARRGLILTPDEVRAAWVDHRTAPRPARFFLGRR